VNRATGALKKLARHDLSGRAVTGGFAVELYASRLGLQPIPRSLHDIDFVTAAFDSIPEYAG